MEILAGPRWPVHERSRRADAFVDFIGWWLDHSPVRPTAIGSKKRETSDRSASTTRRSRPPREQETVPRNDLDDVVDVLATALELRQDGTGQHVRRVTDLALALAADVAPRLALDPQL